MSLKNNKARILNQTLIKNSLFKDNKNNSNVEITKRRMSKAMDLP